MLAIFALQLLTEYFIDSKKLRTIFTWYIICITIYFNYYFRRPSKTQQNTQLNMHLNGSSLQGNHNNTTNVQYLR